MRMERGREGERKREGRGEKEEEKGRREREKSGATVHLVAVPPGRDLRPVAVAADHLVHVVEPGVGRHHVMEGQGEVLHALVRHAAPHRLPHHQAQRVDVHPAKRLEATHVHPGGGEGGDGWHGE